MSKGQTLRALVNERLAAAAEEIFVLIERMIVEYEEELCRSKEENQRKQQLPDKVLYPRIALVRGNVQIPSSPDFSLTQEITETPRIKEEPEEQSVKQEEEQLPEPVPESSAVCVKTEESSLLQQRQTEHREETQGEDVSSETHFHLVTEEHTEHWSDTDNDGDWEPHSSAAAQTETEADADHENQVQSRDGRTKLPPQNETGPEASVHTGHLSGADGKAERKARQCPFCNKSFRTILPFQNHIRLHTGEKPYSCPICAKTFIRKSNLDTHLSAHTGKHTCLNCEKTFTCVEHLHKHMSTHTGDKPFMCLACGKSFSRKGNRDLHLRTHTGEKPYSCTYCEKHFADSSTLRRHIHLHTGEKPFGCLFCKKTFARKNQRDLHTRTHTGEKPCSCPFCKKQFADPSTLRRHMKAAHTEENLLPE